MQICITQINGVRHFSRFKNIPDRDRLEIELTIEDGRQKVFSFDLTDLMFEQFEKYPEILHRKRVIPKDYLPEEQPEKRRVKASKPAVAANNSVEKPETTAKKRTAKAIGKVGKAEKAVETKTVGKSKSKPLDVGNQAKKPSSRSISAPKQATKPVQAKAKASGRPKASSSLDRKTSKTKLVKA
ncbi:MAG: hypothetical protein ABFD64_00780 [Armatimonadota bacterium]